MRLRAASQQEKRERQGLSRKISDLETKMENLQNKIAELEAVLLEVGSNYVRAQEVGSEISGLRDALNETESLWFAASESLAKLESEVELS
jgi:chromosome segregation ATPase